MSYEILSMPGYRAMGIKTEVMYDNISGLEEGMHSIKERVKEFDYIQDATTHLALSYHLHPNGFVHYSAFKVYPEQPLLKGMVDMLVPALTYMKATLSVNDNVYEVYQSLENYLLKSPINHTQMPGLPTMTRFRLNMNIILFKQSINSMRFGSQFRNV
ncbi:putative transcriptional regulator YdeE [Alkalihalobacillus xiaoxiensis]|uniref:Transcriptional regulator YdeE n=1 Tax=Shouchella xiaoxiensis TaxID=766895 RepID=A0ABS2STH3_9BACI|nr:hypothetical protein [Shouchella xiaoxiensis]MBM7838825.1 putative transcriptional regulator YdeE [Shouchella xiaoxiensis]